MARRKMTPHRPRWDFGRKVEQLLLDRSRELGRPVRAAELARDLDLDQGTVMDWIALARSPRAKTGHAVAAWFRVDPGWLLDDVAAQVAAGPRVAFACLHSSAV